MDDSDSDFELDHKINLNQPESAENNLNKIDEIIDKENEELIRKVNEYLKNKTFVFEGYRDLQGNSIVDDESSEYDDHTPIEIKKELVECIVNGNLFKLDDLLRLPDVNINTLFYSENLLMIAIKSNQEKIAEYLIANGINLSHEAKFYEFSNKNFKSQSPFNYFKCSSRQLAYNKNMSKIVDLIDIFDKKTDRRVRNVLAKRYLKETLNKEKGKNNNDSTSFFGETILNSSKLNGLNREELTTYLLSDEANYLQMIHQNEKEHQNEGFDENQNESQETITESSLSYLSNDTLSKDGYLVPRKYRKVDNLNKQIMKQIEDNPKFKSPFEVENNYFKKKCLEYRGYKINLYIQHEQKAQNEFYAKNLNNRKKNELDMNKMLNYSISNKSTNKRLSINTKLPSSVLSESNKSRLSQTPLIIPESVMSYTPNKDVFEKRFDTKISPISTIKQKDVFKISNHNYLAELMSKRGDLKEIINENLTKNEPLFPIVNFSLKTIDGDQNLITNDKNIKNITETKNRTVNLRAKKEKAFDKNSNIMTEFARKQVSFKIGLIEDSTLKEFGSKLLINSSQSLVKNIDETNVNALEKNRNQIMNSYLFSLKKSGLINKNCFPIISGKQTHKLKT